MKYLQSSLSFSQALSLRYCLQMQVWILHLAIPYPIRSLAVAAGGPWPWQLVVPGALLAPVTLFSPVRGQQATGKPLLSRPQSAQWWERLQWWRPWEAAARLVPAQ